MGHLIFLLANDLGAKSPVPREFSAVIIKKPPGTNCIKRFYGWLSTLKRYILTWKKVYQNLTSGSGVFQGGTSRGLSTAGKGSKWTEIFPNLPKSFFIVGLWHTKCKTICTSLLWMFYCISRCFRVCWNCSSSASFINEGPKIK